MLRADAELLLADAKRAGLLPARMHKLNDKDKYSRIVRAGGIQFASPKALAEHLGNPGLTREVRPVHYLDEQEHFFGQYEGRFGHYTSIEGVARWTDQRRSYLRLAGGSYRRPVRAASSAWCGLWFCCWSC